MRLATLSIALAVTLGSSPALAENWVTLFEDEDFGLDVDKDSIRRGADNLVYYQSRAFDKSDRAADCQNRLVYTIKIYAHGGLNYPNWRNDARVVEPGTIGETEFQYVCTNA